MRIPFITEPGYSSASIWCAETRTGIEDAMAKKKYSPVNIDGAAYQRFDYNSLFDGDAPRMVVLIGTSPSWVPRALDFLSSRGIDVILVSYQPPENAPVRGVVRIDYVSGVWTLLRHLTGCGCNRTALYGCFGNSSADLIKRRSFNEYARPHGECCFDNHAGLAACYDAFRSHVREFDSVLCANDIAAASLINRLRRDGITVPEQLQVVCFGSSEISRLYRPSITALTLSNGELGRQTVSIFSYLTKADRSVNVSVRVGGSLIVRDSTRPCADAVPCPVQPSVHTAASSFYEDDEVKAFTMLENILTACDSTDRAILRSLLGDATGEAIAEALSLAPETVRYRIRRLLQATGLKSRGDLLDYIRNNSFGEVFRERL
ncbi:MAG: substrate-binding domain-containing protein [Clostridia bacterium]|nr:substrate-binding domain-containing protein [Clostridia bacterium]